MTCHGKECCPEQGNTRNQSQNNNIGNSIDGQLVIISNDSFPQPATDTQSVCLVVDAMDCAGCANDVDKVLSQIPGIVHHTVSIINSQAAVEYGSTSTSVEHIMHVMKSSGYPCKVAVNGDEETLATLLHTRNRKDLRIRFIQSLSCSLLLYVSSWITKLVPDNPNLQVIHGLLLQDAISSGLAGLLLFIGRQFLIKAFTGIRRGSINLDVLITVAVVAAFMYSLLAVLVTCWTLGATRPETMFEAIGELITVTLLGRWLESAVSSQTTDAMASLMQLTPSTALRIRESSKDTVRSDSLVIDDVIHVLPGSAVPADCIVIIGSSQVDESCFTGDILPSTKQAGDDLYAGTINKSSMLICRVIRSGQDTRMSRTVSMLMAAQSERTAVHVLADRLALVLVRFILLLSLATFLVWLYIDPTRYAARLGEDTGRVLLSLKIAIAVLVITCPCALCVATPTAVAVGTGVASRCGILIRGAPVLERLDSVTDVVFDKTGTLTTGNMQVSDVVWHDTILTAFEKETLCRALATAESRISSRHPVAEAVINYVNTKYALHAIEHAALDNLRRHSGQGFTCDVRLGLSSTKTMHLIVGSTSMLKALDIRLLANTTRRTHGTSMHVALDGKVCCTISFEDSVRPEAAITIRKLSSLHKTIWMLTGDNREAARLVAIQVGIEDDHIIDTMTPEGKAGMIRSLQRQGRVVAFCGDGINDVLALTAADVGFCVTGSTDAAIACAHVILDGTDRLYKIVTTLSLARAVLQKVKFNLSTAMVWNAIMVPVAMGLLLPWNIYISPLLACIAMSVSCSAIITSSLWLKRWKDVGIHESSDDVSDHHCSERSGILPSQDAMNTEKDAE